VTLVWDAMLELTSTFSTAELPLRNVLGFSLYKTTCRKANILAAISDMKSMTVIHL